MKNKYIEEILNENKNIYAHKKETDGNSIKELLLSHMELTYDYYIEMEEYKNLDTIIKNIISNLARKNSLNENVVNKVYEIFKSAIYYHDIGKLNPNFQRENMDNNIKPNIKGTTEHSLISARIYLDAVRRELYEKDSIEKYGKYVVFLEYMAYYFSYIISRHHSRLKNVNEYLTKLEIVDLFDICKIEYIENEYTSRFIQTKLEKFLEVFDIDEVLLYVLCELLYSCLVTADFLATAEFMNNHKIEIKRQKNNKLFNNYESSELFKTIEKYKNGEEKLNGINKLRSDMFIESENNIKNNLDKILYYLEAPTGSGKTNMAINLARILYMNNENLTSINYVFPFNTLIDQTKDTFKNYFKEYEDFIVINSCTPIVDERCEILNYEIAYLKSEFRQYDIKLTSHVNLFDTIFGTSKEGKYNFYDLANSIIVLDEIQAYSNKIWREMIILLFKLAKYLNIKIIIMSATLPKLDYLLKDYIDIENDICSLIKDRTRYFEDKLFKERVNVDFSLLGENKENIIDTLIEKVLKNKYKKVLIEFITKKSSSMFYKKLKELNLNNVYELTGDDNSYTRDKIISRVKEEKSIILIATQTIEAGVDIDMDIGFKDISFLDSEEQFLGRINRSSKKENCIAYFFDLDDENKIYRNDYRAEYTIRNENIKNILKTKRFEEYYKFVMDKIYVHTEKSNQNNISNLFICCKNLDFIGIEDKLQLIDSNTRQIFLNYTINIDGEKIIGANIWRQYKELIQNNNISYAKKQIELSKIKPKFNLFIYTVYKNKNTSTNYYDEEFGGIYYINNGEEFINDGKFDRGKYTSYTGGIFL